MQRKDLKGAFRWFMLVIYGARGSLRILEDLKAMNTGHLGNSFCCQQGGTKIPKYPHLGQAIIQIIYLHSFLSSPLHWGQKLFLLISHKWHCPAQLIIIQDLLLPWLIGMRVHWSICLRISFEATTPPISQSLATELCEIDTAVWTLGIDLNLWLRVLVAGRKSSRTDTFSPSSWCCTELFIVSNLKSDALWKIHAHLSQWLHTLGSSGFRLHAPLVKPRTNSRVSRRSDNPILHVERVEQVRKINYCTDRWISSSWPFYNNLYIFCP